MKSTLCRAVGLLVLVLVSVSVPGQTNHPPAQTLAELQRDLSALVRQPRFEPGTFGVKVVSLDTGRTLFEYDAEKRFSPASNCKLYTVALALDRLGGAYQIKTSLYAVRRPDRFGTLYGDLIVYGRGDPGFNARWHSNDIGQAFEPLVAALSDAGVKRIRGDLLGDESFFRGPPYGSGWNCDDLEYSYGAEISALSINDNLVRLTVRPGLRVGASGQLVLAPMTGLLKLSNRTVTVPAGAPPRVDWYRPLGENTIYVSGHCPMGATAQEDYLTIHHPAELFLSLFKAALNRHGIKVSGKLRTVDWLDRQVAPFDIHHLVELGSVASLPLRQLAREINKPSQNLYADLLLAHVGALTSGAQVPFGKTSEELGVEQLHGFLQKVGVKPDDVQFEEGSGLSRNNLATPNATVVLLSFMDRHPESAAYRESLPIAGVDGSLRNRMTNSATLGNVHAKTGTLRWANALSGYLTSAAGERLAFSIMVNRLEGETRNAMDDLVLQLAQCRAKSDP